MIVLSALVLGVSLLSACAVIEAPLDPDEEAADRERRAGTSPAGRYHTVARGDTVYGIAFRYGLDYRALARQNGIGPPYRIYPGQRLELSRSAKPRPKVARTGKDPGVHAPRQRPVARDRAVASVPRLAPALAVAAPPAPARRMPSGSIRWQWPAHGRLQPVGGGSGRQGLEIIGESGQSVRAAAPGEIVYSGDGLVGYGRLIIIKHDDTYFSAYAHNRRLLVREGIKVSGGQPIAEMGSTGTNQVKLYFEIRRNGKPVPPQDYLPERRI